MPQRLYQLDNVSNENEAWLKIRNCAHIPLFTVFWHLASGTFTQQDLLYVLQTKRGPCVISQSWVVDHRWSTKRSQLQGFSRCEVLSLLLYYLLLYRVVELYS
jgi:hypothetical protein